MKNLYFIVAASGGRMIKDEMEWKIEKGENGLYNLKYRFTDEDYSDDPTEGWKVVYSTTCPVAITPV